MNKENRRKYEKEVYDWNKEHGVCVCCKKEPAVGGVMCRECAARKAAHKYRQYHSMTEAERKEECRKSAERRKALRQRRKEQGLCPNCGKPKYKNYVVCYECYIKQNRKKKR